MTGKIEQKIPAVKKTKKLKYSGDVIVAWKMFVEGNFNKQIAE